MKKLLSLILFFATTFVASAQGVVSGTVVDKKGNPVSGAKVAVVGSTESCMTDLDGVFSMSIPSAASKVRIQYVGMRSQTSRIQPEMMVTLREENFWNRRRGGMCWMVSPQVAFPQNLRYDNPAYGLSIGQMSGGGWYIKGVYSPFLMTKGSFSLADAGQYWTTGKEQVGYYAITFGGIVRLAGPISGYLGIGHSSRIVAWEMASGDYYINEDYSYRGFYDEANHTSVGWTADAGIMLCLKRFTLNAGAMLYLCEPGFMNYVLNAGVGYCF